MKKLLLSIVVIVLSVSCFSGCSNTEIDADVVSNGILNDVSFAEQLQPTSESIALKRLGINDSDVEECIAYTSTNAVVDEFAVIKALNTESVQSAIEEHISTQKQTYSSYAPNEVAKLDSAIVEIAGDYVIYVVSMDNAAAANIIDALIK